MGGVCCLGGARLPARALLAGPEDGMGVRSITLFVFLAISLWSGADRATAELARQHTTMHASAADG